VLEDIITLCRAAGAETLRFYRTDMSVTYKDDQSPLTAADRASHDVIIGGLRNLAPGIPAISEEDAPGGDTGGPVPEQYWLVDPLDGTKEFLKRRDDFTVNVALVQNGKAILGVVYAPAHRVIYFAESGAGAWRQADGSDAIPIRTHPADVKSLRVVASKEHAGPAVEALLRRLPNASVTSIGSSLKFCLVAEGKADFYPRFVPTMEWDTAAAQCVVETAGGQMLTLDGEPLRYGKPGRKNPSIITIGDPAFAWSELL
jgi:3'(2'), 5'-bisphosphate nucleotidase